MHAHRHRATRTGQLQQIYPVCLTAMAYFAMAHSIATLAIATLVQNNIVLSRHSSPATWPAFRCRNLRQDI